MRFHLSSLTFFVLVLALCLGGVLNNVLSVFFVILAIGSWFATAKARGSLAFLGAATVAGWLFAAGLVAAALRH